MPAIPRKIWLMWYQGLASAPYLVHRCVASWRERNPGWEVVLLDRENLSQYLPKTDVPEATMARLGLTKRANLVRLQLLAEHGGVWADATTLCMRPLDEWIDAAAMSGFFAFQRPGPDRLLSNWFLAAARANPLVQAWRQQQADFYRRHRFPPQGRLRLRIAEWLGRRLNRDPVSARRWFNPLITRGLRIYPYFTAHYLFEQVVARDPECARLWRETPPVDAAPPHRIQALGAHAAPVGAIREEIDQRRVPVYKLTWRYDAAEYPPDSLLGYLFAAA